VLELVLRVVFSLSVVLGLLWVIARVSSKRLRGTSRHDLVKTLVRQPLSRGSSLAVVSVGERVLVVGVTEQQVNLLTELDPSEIEAPEAGETEQAPEGGAHVAPSSGALGGSMLSTQTWKQAFAAATKRNGAGS
jgi:flagellar protein FliO/FliZ